MTALKKASVLGLDSGDIESVHSELDRAARCLDLSEIAPEFRYEFGHETAVLLKEVLDRVSLPPYNEIPGADDLQVEGDDGTGVLEEWTVPNTEITIARMTDGSRKGEYLFDAETVANAGDFFERIGSRGYQHNEHITPNLYSGFLYTPGPWIDRKWIQALPAGFRLSALGQAVWQWAVMVLILVLGFTISVLALRVARRWNRSHDATRSPVRSGQILAILLMLLITYGTMWILENQIRITGDVLEIVGAILEIILIALVGWFAATISRSAADTIIAYRHFGPKGLDSQLVRLVFRLLTILVIIGLGFYLADRLGFPAYSVVTGLGVGGLAVALAARETLANFFGSVMIMMDRPFRVGDWIKVGDDEGIVEEIGFRSTRIRTFYDSLLAIPNSEAVNKTVDNMGVRQYRRASTVLHVTYDTPVSRMERFVEGIKQIILAHPNTHKDRYRVVFDDFGVYSLEVLVKFFLEVPDRGSETAAREQIYLDIIRLAEREEVKFAFPTRSLHVESLPTAGVAALTDSPGAADRPEAELSSGRQRAV